MILMSSKKTFYITTTLPYVNAEAHLGHAMEFVRADIVARFKEKEGFEVFFNTGTDEHGQKLFNAAETAGQDVKVYVDEYAKKFKELLPKLGISENINFIRTTDSKHVEAAKEFWKRVEKNGYIYKKNYKTKYCVGCEAEKTDSELIEGKCGIHPQLSLEIIEEENYFFKFSQFGERLLKFYEENPDFVTPDFRMNEMREFVKRGLEDFSISRLKSKMSWGVPVPGDEEHVMYVWFDALVSYISTLGWPADEETFKKYWKDGTPTQYCGKDNTRFQSVMWQAMLMAADLPNSSKIVVNGFVTGEGGIKMSKSLGNVINPLEIINDYGTDALRYFVSRELSMFEDSPFTIERFKDAYNANLANGLGNLVSRVLTMSEKNLVNIEFETPESNPKIKESLEKFEINKAMDIIWAKVGELDKKIQETEPFKLVKSDPEKGKEIVKELLEGLFEIATNLSIFMPATSTKILEAIKNNKLEQPLFPRKI